MKGSKHKRETIEEQKLKLYERVLEIDEWHLLLDTLDAMPENNPHEQNDKERLRFLVSILYLLGLRIGELEKHRWNAFRKVQGRWWFFVIGKGDKPAKIPVNDSLLETIKHYREHLRFENVYPTSTDDLPLIASWKNLSKSLTARHMNKLLKKLAFEAADRLMQGAGNDEVVKQFKQTKKTNGVERTERIEKEEKAEKLKRFSAHWLRHLSASMQDIVGIKFKHIRANHRHENDNTTRLYVHALDEERHDEMNRLTLRINPHQNSNGRVGE